MKIDNIHYNRSKICSYNKPFNFTISPREAGKTTSQWRHTWANFKNGYSTLIIRRRVIDITEAYINDTLDIISKFCSDFDREKIYYKRGGLKEGIVDIFYDKKIFFRVIGLSKDLYALKGLMLKNINELVFDEFICNMRLGEKYLKDEAFKFKELYNTFQRECDGVLKCFFLGNPYSLYNPYFDWLGVDTTKLVPGAFIVEETYVIECYEISPELKAHILKKNPLYKFDDAYTKYGFNGLAVNDMNIRVNAEKPSNFKLVFGFRINGKFIGVFENNNLLDWDTDFYISEIDSISARKKIYCFDFNDLVDRTALVSNSDRFNFSRLKRAFQQRKIVFNNIQCYYLIEEVYIAL